MSKNKNAETDNSVNESEDQNTTKPSNMETSGDGEELETTRSRPKTNSESTGEEDEDADNETSANETTENETTENNESNNNTENDDVDSDDNEDDDGDSDDDSENNDTQNADTDRDDLNTNDEKSSQFLGVTKTSFSQEPTSQASMALESDRQGSTRESIFDTTGRNLDKDDLDVTSTIKKKPPKQIKIQQYINTKNESVYTVSAKAFTRFEDMLLNFIGINNETILNPDDPELNKITKLVDFDNPEFSTAFVPDMQILNTQLDYATSTNACINVNYLKSEKTETRSILRKGSKDTKSSSSLSIKDPGISHGKIIIIIANATTRPRKIVRILLNKRNGNNFDQVMNDICNALKMEYGTFRKLYTLKGVEITNPAEFFKFDKIFLAVGGEKINNRDFELDYDEVNSIFANELVKPVPNFKMMKTAQRFLNKKSASKSSAKIKPDIKTPTTPFDNDPDKLPADLLQNYKIGDIIGEGNFATVHECTDINTGIKFALKTIDIRKCKGREFMIENELNILRKVKHPNVIKLIEEYRSEHKFYLIMELLKYGDLLDAITTTSKYTERDAAVMIYNLASALAYLHSMNIAHRDVKLENILIHKHPDGSKSLKLGDFGLAVEIKDQIDQICGTPIYVAPEILFGKSYGCEVDVWSLGIIAYILLCGFAPFRGENDEEIFKAIKHDNLEFLSPFWDDISTEAKDLIKKMLNRDQNKRIKASEILIDPWLNEGSIKSPKLPSSAGNNKMIEKSKNLQDDVSRNLAEYFRRSSRNPAVALVTTTSLDKEPLKAVRTPALEKVDENHEDI